jgi:deazaflavin-dependent oxidoreductase (nitroreductase family)
MSLLSAPPTRLMRWCFRIPLWLYRANLGWLLGHRLARLTHRGRRTGQIHQTVVEVVRFDPHTREIVVAAAWGGQTDWYRNIQQSPALEVRSGRLSYLPSQRFLTPDETYQELRRYTQRHPWVARHVLPRLLGLPVDGPESQRRDAVDATLRGVAFRPRADAGAQAGSPTR